MAVPFLDLKEQYEEIRDEVDAGLRRVVESQHFILGPEVEAAEAEVAEVVGAVHAVGCASGTDALLLPLRALEPEEGDEVVVPAFTFFATAGAAWNAGFRPVFCDVDEDTFNVTGETVEAACSERTRAVVPVHLYGQMAPVEALAPLAEDRDLFVLEDCAQALGAARRPGGDAGGDAGSSGDAPADAIRAGAASAAAPAGHAGAFSFFPTKNVGGFGDGGMITAADADLADRLRKLRVHGGLQMYHHETVGTNSRLDALQAAVIRAKLPHLERWLEARRAHAAVYDEMLADVDGVVTPHVLPGNTHTYNQYTLRVRKRDELRAHLTTREIGSGVYYPVPLHLQECFAELGYGPGDLPVSEMLCDEVVSLPVFPELGEERAREVAEAIREFYGA